MKSYLMTKHEVSNRGYDDDNGDGNDVEGDGGASDDNDDCDNEVHDSYQRAYRPLLSFNFLFFSTNTWF